MLNEVRLPQLGQTMKEGAIVAVLVRQGDEVKKGDILFEVETDKATVEIESSHDGFVKKILVGIDDTMPVDMPMLILGDPADEVTEQYVADLSVPQKNTVSDRTENPVSFVDDSDVIKAIHADQLVEIAALGEVKPGQRIAISKLHQVTAERMLQSKHEIPCFYLTVKIDVTNIPAILDEVNQTADVNVEFDDVLIKTVALSLRHYPVMMGQIDGDCVNIAGSINIAWSTPVVDSIISPVIKDADVKSLAEIAASRLEMTALAESGRITEGHLGGACTTICHLADHGVYSFIPIVVPGQCTIVGVGSIIDTCVPSGKNIEIRKVVALTLSVDHKVANGAEAAQFLDYIKKMFEHPSSMNA
ncbi:MAG: 2-oxo acid dehydrogenase subunit E2 [Anaerohalosphaera sp.]|nr:2-oxo acid dehydrogenase subunit E2 [Anaerohalosphaera sp.]